MNPLQALGAVRRTFFWKISRAYFLLVLFSSTLVGVLLLWLWSNYRDHSLQWTQWELAEVYASSLLPLLRETPPDDDAILQKIYTLQEKNPEAVLYVLDSEGKVQYALDQRLRDVSVDPKPLQKFTSHSGQLRSPLYGSNPQETHARVPFSATKISYQGQQGYLYVVLSSSRFSVLGEMGRQYSAIRGAVLLIMLAVGLSLILGVVVFSLLTRRLRRLTATVTEFRQGNLDARIEDSAEDEVAICAQTFNEMAAQIQSTLHSLEARDEARRVLISDIAHDLRRPVTLSSVALQQLSERLHNLDQGEQLVALSQIAQSFSGLESLLDDFFELAKLQDISMRLQESDFLIDELCEEVYHQFQKFAAEKEISFTLELPDHPLAVRADEHLVQRAIANLTENALHYTPKGGSVSLEAFYHDAQKQEVTIRITDSGIGMSKEEITQIFERFYRSDEAKRRNAAGTGLGMAIVKRSIDAHTKELHIESTPGEGTTIYFSLNSVPTASSSPNKH